MADAASSHARALRRLDRLVAHASGAPIGAAAEAGAGAGCGGVARAPTAWVLQNVDKDPAINPTASLRGKTLFITGATRGIGKAIGLAAAKEGANVVIAAKTTEPRESPAAAWRRALWIDTVSYHAGPRLMRTHLP